MNPMKLNLLRSFVNLLSSSVVLLGLAIGELSPSLFAQAAPSPDSKTAAGDYLLRYKLEPGEQLRWRVVHRASVRTKVTETEQTAETVTQSVKTWKVLSRQPDGAVTFELQVDDVEMTHRISGRPEVKFSSRGNSEPPVGFEEVAKTVGKPLARITLNSRGEVLERKQLEPEAFQSHGYLTVPLPENPVSVGATWAIPDELTIPMRNGTVRKVKVQQRFTLREVRGDRAVIEVKTQVLSPIEDPEVEIQLVQRLSEGTITFDIAAGRIVSQEIEADRQVVGFQGAASSFHYRTRFTEEILTEKVAGRPADNAPKR